MPLSIDQERQQIEAEESKIAQRKKRLEEREREELISSVTKSGMLKNPNRAMGILARIKKLGLEETERRLSDKPAS